MKKKINFGNKVNVTVKKNPSRPKRIRRTA